MSVILSDPQRGRSSKPWPRREPSLGFLELIPTVGLVVVPVMSVWPVDMTVDLFHVQVFMSVGLLNITSVLVSVVAVIVTVRMTVRYLFMQVDMRMLLGGDKPDSKRH